MYYSSTIIHHTTKNGDLQCEKKYGIIKNRKSAREIRPTETLIRMKGGEDVPHQRGTKTVAQNRKAWHDYFVEDRYECGVALFGTEVKSIRQGRVNLKESWARIRDGEIWVEGMHISPYEQGNIFNRDPMRPKKLLMHKQEIRKLDGLVARQGFTLIPLEIYLKDGRVKVLLGLCKGKAEHDKRDSAAKRDADREIHRAIREHNK